MRPRAMTTATVVTLALAAGLGGLASGHSSGSATSAAANLVVADTASDTSPLIAAAPRTQRTGRKSSTQPVAPVSTAPPADMAKTLVILASWTEPDAVTPDAVTARMAEADSWLREVSYGQLGMETTVTPWLGVAGPDRGECYADMAVLMTQAIEAAAARGFEPATFDRTMLYFPHQTEGDCARFTAWAQQPGTWVWLNGTLELATIVHEMGHNLGLGHADALACYAGAMRITLGSTCEVVPYGDPHDVMGGAGNGALAHYQARSKASLGWLSGRVADLSAGGTEVLQPLESTSGIAAIRIAAGGREYWLEHRTASGYDSSLDPGGLGGVLVREVSAGTELLDVSPADDFANAVIAVGDSWSSPEGLKISVSRSRVGGVTVRVAT